MESAYRIAQLTRDNGGCTFDVMTTGDVVTSGLAVSPFPQYERIVPLELFMASDIVQYIDDNEALLVDYDMCIGTWVNNNKVYIDVSMVVDNALDAERIAKEYHQLAYYDMDNNVEILVEGNV